MTGPTQLELSQREIAVVRIAQAALNNVARQAGAKTVCVSVSSGAGEFVLGAQDDSKGFTVPERMSALAAGGHYGLMGMQERADD